MTQFNLVVRTLSPVHIGSGSELRLGFDFNVQEDCTYRLNVDTILEDKYDPVSPDRLPSQMLEPGDYRNSRYFRYAIPGKPRTGRTDGRLRECIKDVHDCPFIPGSSLKGAMRTALAVELLRKKNSSLGGRDFPSSNAKHADDQIEKSIFGVDANHDFFKALQVSDVLLPEAKRKPGAALYVANTTPITQRQNNSSVPIEVECIRSTTEFSGTLRIDDYFVEKLFTNERETLGGLMVHLNQYSQRRVARLVNWYSNAPGCEKITSLLSRLLEKSKDFPDSMALLQVGFGSGWDGNTYGELLQANTNEFEKLMKQFNLQRRTRGGGGSIPRKPGDPFPLSRKVETNNQQPVNPLGWVLLNLERKEE